MIQREVTDAEQLGWSCVQTHSQTVADVAADDNWMVTVVCTPSGGARSVRVELPPTWAQDLPDPELLAAIARARTAP